MAQIPSIVADERPEGREARAQAHFDRALALYRRGLYARARDELTAAAELDPYGKDLFFNLALVQEKLGALDEAIAALERFRALEADDDERGRAQATIERLRGAQQATAANAAPRPGPPASAPASAASPALIGSASVAVVSLIVGVIYGAKALNDDVGGERTSGSFSVAQLRERGRRAEREALVADIAFALAAASSGTFVCLWLLSPSQQPARGATLNVGGRF